MAFTAPKLVKRSFLLMLFLASNLLSSSPDDNVPYIVYTKEIIGKFIGESEKTYNLDCVGTGGRFSHNVAVIDINFIAYRKGTIEEARILEVALTEALLKAVNENEKIRSFLNEYPFKAGDIHISLSFNKKDNSSYDDGSVAHTFTAKNNRFYCSRDPKTGLLTDLLKEPYEEARKKVLPLYIKKQ